MANFSNNLRIDVDVFLRFRNQTRDAFSKGPTIPANGRGKPMISIPNLGDDEDLELHIEIPVLPFQNAVNGIVIEPGNTLGEPKNNFKVLQKLSSNNQNNRGIVYAMVVKYTPGSPIGGDEPQVLHPEDSPID